MNQEIFCEICQETITTIYFYTTGEGENWKHICEECSNTISMPLHFGEIEN